MSVSWKKNKMWEIWSTLETNEATVTTTHIVTFTRGAQLPLHTLKTGHYYTTGGTVNAGYRSSNFFKIQLENKAKKKKKKAERQWDYFPKDITFRQGSCKTISTQCRPNVIKGLWCVCWGGGGLQGCTRALRAVSSTPEATWPKNEAARRSISRQVAMREVAGVTVANLATSWDARKLRAKRNMPIYRACKDQRLQVQQKKDK